MAKVKKTLALEIISFKHPQTNDTALVRMAKPTFPTTAAMITSKSTAVHTVTMQYQRFFFYRIGTEPNKLIFETWSQSEQMSKWHPHISVFTIIRIFSELMSAHLSLNTHVLIPPAATLRFMHVLHVLCFWCISVV